MKVIKGDLIQLGRSGRFDVIVHGCNCFCLMGNGIAKQIKSAFPDAYYEDKSTIPGDEDKLGSITYVKVKTGRVRTLTVINAYTQFTIGSGKQVSYKAIADCFIKIKEKFSGLRIGYPKIGAGLGGGDWNKISKIIDKVLDGEKHYMVEYDKN